MESLEYASRGSTMGQPNDVFLAYKYEKEINIKLKANMFKNRLDHKVYNALLSWSVDNLD